MPLQNARTPADGTTVEPFEYASIDPPPMPSWAAFGFNVRRDDGAAADDGLAAMAGPATKPSAGNEAEKTRSQELKQSFENGRMRGIEEGRVAERESLAGREKALETSWDEQLAQLVESFDGQRKEFFESAEREVVQLALAVAARILHRESQMDPLIVSGAVRAALGQLSSTTKVRLRVPAADLELWSQTISHLPNLNLKPDVVADEKMRLGECALECELGSVDLGIASQLAEIERGFFDRSGVDRAPAHSIAVEEDMSE